MGVEHTYALAAGKTTVIDAWTRVSATSVQQCAI